MHDDPLPTHADERQMPPEQLTEQHVESAEHAPPTARQTWHMPLAQRYPTQQPEVDAHDIPLIAQVDERHTLLEQM